MKKGGPMLRVLSPVYLVILVAVVIYCFGYLISFYSAVLCRLVTVEARHEYRDWYLSGSVNEATMRSQQSHIQQPCHTTRRYDRRYLA